MTGYFKTGIKENPKWDFSHSFGLVNDSQLFSSLILLHSPLKLPLNLLIPYLVSLYRVLCLSGIKQDEDETSMYILFKRKNCINTLRTDPDIVKSSVNLNSQVGRL